MAMSKSLVILVALKLGLGLAVPAALADEAYDRCMKQANATTMAFSSCGGDWMKREDDKLNAAWKRVFAQAEGQTKTDLLEEQRAWIAFKDKACGFYANGDWGTEGRAIQYPMCQAGIIAARTRDIDAIGKFLAPK
ncbi:MULTISPECIES: lysozyme inhibitor LprI family protein [unclassified Chelatococcus]|uniref:lysozyme inhibitor LprI family protein n=1 Tax=unclassified Chelatococcus TaxID=2638111 RepID=UPI0020BF3B37|nr:MULTISPECIES: lysozyme inhibitor LprI family protein [unclassified Chelatococcus]MCO5078604.1 lysozyme inhibitor LprI family protein [Chelatococcus sp.]CAH1653270.1 conserved exported hypothetical protein [Hyphomicrobiales bacterium]CAH1685750.1 conserved exported hypothetical protein [Hyphomicrobiales bacterium]